MRSIDESSMSKPLSLALVCLLAVAAGIGLYRYAGLARPAAPQARPAGLRFTGLDGKPHALDEWHGKLLLVNFWATWCTPCLHEIPELVKLQKQYAAQGLQIVGPAVDDPDSVKSMLGPLGINYPVLTGTPDAMIDLMGKLGNSQGGLPFSILVSPDGKIIDQQLGPYTATQLSQLLLKHLPVSVAQ
jgi:thiol-disulfide isomerase/thioredoxin